MATMTQQAARFTETRHHLATTAALVTLLWLIAAAGVAASHAWLDSLSPSSGAVLTIAVIAGCAYCYMRFCAPQAGISHALGVGIAWLVLGIVTEIVMTTHLHQGWFGILGSPNRPLSRNIVLFVWIFAPVVFAKREESR